MDRKYIRSIGSFAVSMSLALSVIGLGVAQAKDGDVIKRGVCSQGSAWKLKLSPEDGRIEVEYEVDSNVVGEVWGVRIKHNGKTVFRGLRETKAPSGSFTVRLLQPDLADVDRFRAAALNLTTEEICRGGAAF